MSQSGAMTSTIGFFAPRVLIRLEGGAAFALAVALYDHHGDAWWLFLLLFLAPDLSMVGFLAGSRAGAMLYNLVHTYMWPAALGGYGVMTDGPLLVSLALIWLAHIGLDRLLGFGLKYETGFKDTHLQRL